MDEDLRKPTFALSTFQARYIQSDPISEATLAWNHAQKYSSSPTEG